MKKNIFIAILISIFFMSTISASAIPQQFPEKIGVDPDKIWKIEFSNPVAANQEDTVSVTKEGESIEIEIEVDWNYIYVAGAEHWEQGAEYTVHINGTKDAFGNSLAFDVEMSFTVLMEGQLRVELSWGELPYDLDIQLYVRDRFKNYYFVHPAQPYVQNIATIDMDVMSGFGVETMVIEPTDRTKVYTLMVAQISDEVELRDSQAVIEVYTIEGKKARMEVPTQLRGGLWGVFRIRFNNFEQIGIQY